jgi:hypothetical protein
MTIKHATTKAEGEKLFAVADWNAEHSITGMEEGRMKSSVGGIYIGVPGVEFSTISTLALIANRDYYFPMYCTSKIVLSDLLAEVTTLGAGGKARLGIYNADTDWQPTTLIIDAGEIDTSATGIKTASIDITLPPGRYLLAINAKVAATFRVLRGGTIYQNLNPVLSANAFFSGAYGSRAYGAFPAAGTLWSTGTTGTTHFSYVVFVKISSFP